MYALDAIIFTKEPPTYEIIDGLVHVKQATGGICFERVMLLSTFMRAIAAAQAALIEYEERGTAQVIPVSFDSKFEKVYPADKKCP